MSAAPIPPFNKILIANRGEIACRIIRTAKRLGIGTVAVHSSADAGALHVRMADEACWIGESKATSSYLNIEVVLETATRCGVEAIHPGYGFLSENADFSQAVTASGIVFVGPPPEAIRLMGEKNAALQRVRDAGVSTLPNNLGSAQDDASLRISADAVGYPLMVKPSAGGGGKGMHIVSSPDQLDSVLKTSRREAGASFGNQALLIEKYLEHARHIEIQVFADTHGNVVHLFERDCSVQRRHQKVIEESPATGLSEPLLEQLQSEALLATRSINYVGAGTVEFLVADDQIYFLEMNTRLQVEHPVTEVLTGTDLVEWQLRVAAGEPIPFAQNEIARNGHAIETRVYAEDPDAGFLPASGKVTRLELPAENHQLRIDSGLQVNDEIGIHYDPLLMKLIAHRPTREETLNEITTAIENTDIQGVKTNLAYLTRVLSRPDYRAGRFDTGFLDSETKALTVSNETADESTFALACLYVLLTRHRDAGEENRADKADPHSPWGQLLTWRLNHHAFEKLTLRNNGVDTEISVLHQDAQCYVIDEGMTLSGELASSGKLTADLDKRSVTVFVTRAQDGFIIDTGAELHRFNEVGIDDTQTDGIDQTGHLRSPMPGTIVSINVNPGDEVVKGQALMVLEAMKMEHTITAPAPGVVSEVMYQTGDRVDADVELLVIE